MLPSEKNKQNAKFILGIAQMVGLRMTNGNHLNIRIGSLAVLCITFVVMQINGLIYVWPEFIKIFNSLMIDALALQLITRLVNKILFLEGEEELAKVELEIEDFYQKEEVNEEHKKILDSMCSYINIALKSYMTLNGISFLVPSMASLIVSSISGDFIYYAPIFLPFTDPETFSGFVINQTLLAMTAAAVFNILICVDLAALFNTLQFFPIGRIYSKKLKNLGEKLLEAKQNEAKIEELISKERKNISILNKQRNQVTRTIKSLEDQISIIINDFTKYNNFINVVMSSTKMSTFVAISSNAVAIGMSILICLFFSMPIGISFGLIFVVEVLLPCIQGTIISDYNEKIRDEVWNFPWYELSNSKQKIWLQFIHQCQNANEFKIWVVGQLNMECFSDVIKAAYSSSVCITKFVK